MELRFEKYQGTGNDFIMIDDRAAQFPAEDTDFIAGLCHRRFGIGADGLILLRNCSGYDFEMVYFNADGKLGSMCGNGGRCTVRFAQSLQLFGKRTHFLAADGPHEAFIDAAGLVHLKMQDVAEVQQCEDYFFADTGSPHYIRWVDGLEKFPVVPEGRAVRYASDFAPGGTNVNFVSPSPEGLALRTYERGVEDETWACGTGATAVALAAAMQGAQSPVRIQVKGGTLQIAFKLTPAGFTDIYLIGPAQAVFQGSLTR